ncbi:MraZ protein [Caldicellulosiruptor saccharolyticus DSM 8903]|uniref:Transcriptional regulator MraZ n=1 Tax=Caldicellulosiruptor saccharolyticus (strain ATCC 43494 / DSM 8903 / Tp8T 6331) TaxID=351627 RepID=MRAZ_CALS8|nr:division/cell wall cluster transcriptional repressor MraZ [Caldicellulosiruptor saccharolyticus]A4XHZ5.1 RecName: Full=Transcriptional regulator MraZ [Caldicellulosiruptor saccharolyticus DSM 8903]ABP66530.1 MraZ protein [Caldicellulosiruptor saccharolyticus DSM 8903]
MLIGEYKHVVDNKGRVTLPSKFREELGEKFILTKGLDNCLFGYSLKEWAVLEEKLKKLPLTSKDARAFLRFFFAGACECEVDKQGRILIPQNLREYANLQKEVFIIGVMTRIEIWSEENWQREMADESLSVEKIAQKMEELGI